jgi:hypothetical protein
MKEWMVTAREQRTFAVDYFVRARTAEEAREKVKAGKVDDETAMLESVYSQDILKVEENK